MRYKLLGKSGLRVSELCLGTMTFGKEFGWGADKRECRKVFSAFANAGGNFIDTANHYTRGTSEKMVGEFIASERDRYVVATKYTLNQRPDDPNGGGNHRKSMVQALEASLKRLKTDYIDLYWVHMWDELTPIEEMMRALDDMVRAGKILYVGISDVPAWVVARSNTLAELKGWTPFVGLQLQYSLIERTIEHEFFPMADAMDLSLTAWSILGGGTLTGKYSHKGEETKNSRFTVNKEWGKHYLTPHNLKIAQTVEKIAKEMDCSAADVAINWVRQQHPRMIPIIGARTEEQLKGNLSCLDYVLSPEQMNRLNTVSAVPAPFPQNFLSREPIQRLVQGDFTGKIDR